MGRVRLLLLPLCVLYWMAVVVRNRFFDIGILKTGHADVPVISIGNISTGGSGKTPLVEMLALRLKRMGRKVAVISRGYGRKTTGYLVVSDGLRRSAAVEDAGDEASQMADKLEGVVVAVDEIRVRAARNAVQSFGVDVILLDDGFQHRSLHRDLDIVVVTADEILRGDWLLPAGNRREPMNSLKRSDVVIVSRCTALADFKSSAEKLRACGKPLIGIQTKLRSMRRASSGLTVEPGTEMRKAVAFSGIGNPQSFENILSEAGLCIVKHLAFADHHWYGESDIEKIIEARKSSGADAIVTTEKDAARLKEEFKGFLERERVVVVEIEQEILAGEEELNAMLERAVQGAQTA